MFLLYRPHVNVNNYVQELHKTTEIKKKLLSEDFSIFNGYDNVNVFGHGRIDMLRCCCWWLFL